VRPRAEGEDAEPSRGGRRVVEQPRLADAGRALDEHDRPAPLRRPRQRIVQLRALGLALEQAQTGLTASHAETLPRGVRWFGRRCQAPFFFQKKSAVYPLPIPRQARVGRAAWAAASARLRTPSLERNRAAGTRYVVAGKARVDERCEQSGDPHRAVSRQRQAAFEQRGGHLRAALRDAQLGERAQRRRMHLASGEQLLGFR